jgi:hypothetical protein
LVDIFKNLVILDTKAQSTYIKYENILPLLICCVRDSEYENEIYQFIQSLCPDNIANSFICSNLDLTSKCLERATQPHLFIPSLLLFTFIT